MLRLPPRSTRTDTLFPYTPLFRSDVAFEVPLFSAAQTNVPGYVWFADPANGASAGRNLGSHMLHLLVHAFGPVASVTADQSLALKAWPVAGATVRPQVPTRAPPLLPPHSGLPTRLSATGITLGGAASPSPPSG